MELVAEKIGLLIVLGALRCSGGETRSPKAERPDRERKLEAFYGASTLVIRGLKATS